MEDILARLFEHNHWANLRLIRACATLGDEHLDAEPRPPSTWSIRQVLVHLVESQQGYHSLLTLPPEARQRVQLSFFELEESARGSGEKLLALARDGSGAQLRGRLRTRDGYFVEPWVVLVQAIHHAADHRRQVCDQLRARGVAPPELDGWSFGMDTQALVPIPT